MMVFAHKKWTRGPLQVVSWGASWVGRKWWASGREGGQAVNFV